MSVQYAAVKWNANKRAYDMVIGAGVSLYLAMFFGLSKLAWRGDEGLSDEVILIRGLGTCAFVMLHLVLGLGPLARLDRRFLPLVYNRRHLGVATFLVGLAHAAVATGYYHGFGAVNPLLSLLTSNRNVSSWSAFPFELFGAGALLILFLLAATSHDFWQKNLGPSFWKALHMAVYVAYGLLVLHVAAGALQAEGSPVYLLLALAGLAALTSLHLATGLRERRRDRGFAHDPDSSWIAIGCVDEIRDGRAKIVCPAGAERVAVFRQGTRLFAVSNVCAHQRGPLGEGKLVNGCIMCPWHGWEYRPEDGRSPPPFGERIATYRLRVDGRQIWLDPRPLPPGTRVEPAHFEELHRDCDSPARSPH